MNEIDSRPRVRDHSHAHGNHLRRNRHGERRYSLEAPLMPEFDHGSRTNAAADALAVTAAASAGALAATHAGGPAMNACSQWLKTCACARTFAIAARTHRCDRRDARGRSTMNGLARRLRTSPCTRALAIAAAAPTDAFVATHAEDRT
ncbi:MULTISPECIES: hypothetical protein [Burkholderia]|uniref:hypothetical protein n=1 Tax=Burkholderia TaxID=32008 RepID=UPI000A5F3595|nr:MULTISPECIES: hypothetical protein [Burkholderia]